MARPIFPIGPNAWISILSIIASLELAAIGAVWYGGGLASKLNNQGVWQNKLQGDIETLRMADGQGRKEVTEIFAQLRKELTSAIDERNKLLSELERRITDRNDAVNEKIASATATNQATRDMLMMLERRLELLESERRNK